VRLLDHISFVVGIPRERRGLGGKEKKKRDRQEVDRLHNRRVSLSLPFILVPTRLGEEREKAPRKKERKKGKP